jgi:hypothetical protein
VPSQNYITASTVITPGAIYKNQQILFEGTSAPLSDFLLAAYQNFEIKYPKFYKMDSLGKLGWLAAEILLKNSEVADRYQPFDVGIVFSNANSSLDTDIKYYETTKDIASPALFVYTLPNIVIGEICIRHHFKGENSFFIFDKFDASFIERNVNGLLNNNILQACICGWVEVIGEQYKAALYLVEKSGNENSIPFDEVNILKIYQLENG